MTGLSRRRCISLLSLCLMAASGLAVSGCSDNPPPRTLVAPKMSFTQYLPIYLDVANIDIVDEYKPPMKEPNVEHLLPIMPSEAMRTWVKDRIRSVGIANSLQVIIRDASVVAVELPVKNTLTGYFEPGPDKRYDARLEVELRIYGGNNAMSEASVVVVSTQSNSISKAATVEERKSIFMGMLYQMMESANAELEKQIFKYFPRFIIYAQTP